MPIVFPIVEKLYEPKGYIFNWVVFDTNLLSDVKTFMICGVGDLP